MTAARPPRGPRIAIALGFLVLFLQPVLVAVANVVGLAGFAAVMGRQLNTVVWVLLIAGLLIPVAGFAAGLVLGARRTPGAFALVLLVAFCATEAVGLSQLAFFQRVIGVL